MKKYIVSTVLFLVFVGIMQVSVFAPPPGLFDNSTAELRVVSGIRAAQYTTASMGNNFHPSNSNWTNIQASGSNSDIIINVPYNATYINFLYWDFGTFNQVSAPNTGWLFGGTTTFSIGGMSANIGSLQQGDFELYTPPSFNAIRARGKYVAISTSHFQRINNERVTIKLVRWNTVAGQQRLVDSEVNFFINWTGVPLPPAPSLTGISYDDLTQTVSGITSAMEYSVFTTSWSSWFTGTSQPINLSSYLSTSRTTTVRIRYRNPQSEQVGFIIPAVPKAPTHLYLTWEYGYIFLDGLKANHVYALSYSTDFSGNDFLGYISAAHTSAYDYFDLTAYISPGDPIYVREFAPSNDAYFSDYVMLIAPTAQVPNAKYSAPTHELTFPSAGTYYVRVNPDSGGDWNTFNATSPSASLNLYPYLSVEHETQIDIAAPWSGSAFQTIIVPPLDEAPDLWVEWISDLGLVVWGFELDYVYDFSLNPEFYPMGWFIAEFYGELMGTPNPGDKLYLRVAKDLSSPPSAFIELTVPPLPHDIKTSVVGLEYDNGVYGYDAININDNFKVSINRQLYIVLKKYDSAGNITTSPDYPVTVNNNGFNLLASAIDTSFRNFTAEESIEILVYSDSAAQNQLNSQTILPLLLEFE
ncbi:MAG: hypothetical protein FWG87_11500 [Defluviitaleaceae bacterium]|nr:hypothetical protein [Defluviitaleaceae bacterium]